MAGGRWRREASLGPPEWGWDKVLVSALCECVHDCMYSMGLLEGFTRRGFLLPQDQYEKPALLHSPSLLLPALTQISPDGILTWQEAGKVCEPGAGIHHFK